MLFGSRVPRFRKRAFRQAELKAMSGSFFSEDRRDAEKVKSIVESELARLGYRISLDVLERDGKKFQFAAPGKIEVWIPALPTSSIVQTAKPSKPRRVGRYLINLCESTIVEDREDVTNVDSGFKAMLKRIGKVAMNDAI